MPQDPKQSSNSRYIWAIFMNAPAAECLALRAEADKILLARNIIKTPRTRKAKPTRDEQIEKVAEGANG